MKKLLYFLFFALPFWGTAQTLSIEVTANKSDVLTCETYKYTLKYSCAAGTGNCSNVTMTAAAPSGMIFPDQQVGLTSDILSATFAADKRSISFVFKEPLIAGNTGIVELQAQGECGKPEGTLVTLTGSIQSGTGTPATATVNTTLHSSNKFCPGKNNGIGLAVDNSTYYDIFLRFSGNGYATNGFGTASVTDVVMVDNLPPNTVINGVTITGDNGTTGITYPSNTCVIDNTPSAPKVTCTFLPETFKVISSYAPGTTVRLDVTYPDANFNTGDNVTNSVTVTYTPEGGSPITATNGSTITYQNGTSYGSTTTSNCTANLNVTDVLVAPTSVLQPSKGSYATSIKPGEIISYEVNIANTGNTVLNNVVVEDAIPADLLVTQIDKYTNLTGMVGSYTITYWIKTVSTPTYTQVMTNPADNFYAVPTGEVVTNVKIEVSSMAIGSSILYSKMYVKLKPGSTATSVTNCLTGSTSNAGANVDLAFACKTLPVEALDTFSRLQIRKWISSSPNDQYQLYYGVAQNIGTVVYATHFLENKAGGQPLLNPVFMDLLPAGLTFNNAVGDIIYGTSSCSFPAADAVEVIPNYNGTGRTLIRLKWNSPWPSGCDKWISFRTTINSLGIAGNGGIPDPGNAYDSKPGAINASFFTGSSATKCYRSDIYVPFNTVETVDKFDLDGDGATTGDTLCFAMSYVGITSAAQMESVKWVKGECDTVYTKHPNYGQTMPGGLANYKLIVKNNGNVPTKDIEILDILPYIGDIGVKDVTPRLTAWRPNLVTPIATPTGVTVYYTTVQNPCRNDYVAAGPAGCNPPNWTTVLPADPTTVQGLKFDFGTKILNPGDEIELTWDMRAPVNAPTNNEIAWNSFGFKATRADNNDPFLPAEPNKVGIKVKPIVPGAYGNFVWIDTNKDGKQDAGEPGIDGVRVELHRDNGDGIADPKNDELVSFTSTGNGGKYLFPNLKPDNYFAVFFVPNGYSTSPANTVTPGDSLDSDGVATICNGNRVTVTEITDIAALETDLRWDQGVYVDKAALGNYVWFDQNSNNIQDESTTNGVNGVIVCLYKDVNNSGTAEPDAADGAPVARDTTSTDIYGRPGYYLFENLDPGKYFVKFKLATGQTFTPNSGTVNGSSDPSDSDPSAAGVTEVTDLAAGEVDLTWDAGIIIQTGPYNLGNFVWSDVNNNGLADGAETGINGVSVILYEDRNNNNKPDPDEYVTSTTTTTITGIAGTYTFTNLPAGNYIVQIPDANFSGPLKDFVSSTGNDPAPDPDDNVENDDNGTAVAGCGIISKPITLGNNAEPLDGGVTNYSVDFGFYKCTKPNYKLEVVQPTCAGGKGSILLGPGTGGDKVAFTTGDISTIPTYANATLISSLTGGVIVGNINNPPSDVTYLVRIYNGEDGCFKDFMFTIKPLICCVKPVAKATPQTQTICAGETASAYTATPATGVEYKWYGPLADTTGTLGTAVSGQTAASFTPSGTALTTTGTKYFAVIVNTTGDVTCADTAFVQLIVNAPLTIATVPATICAGESVDLISKVTDYASLKSPVWTLTIPGGTAVSTPNSVKPTTTTTYVLVAQNAAGCKDTANVVVTVNPKPTITSANGFPVCRVNGTAYTIKFVATGGTVTTVPALTVTGDSIANIPLTTAPVKLIITGAGGCKDSIEVTAPTCDKPVGSIGDLIWKDVNDNGLQDLPTEKGVAGVKVNLYAAAAGTKTGSVLQTKTTGTDGLYLFTGLLAGDYIVEIDKTSLKDTCAITPKQNIPGDDTKDSDFNPTSGLSQVITLAPVFNPTTPADILATNNLTVDAGLVKVCITPTRTVAATDPTCAVAGKIELTATNGDKYGISKGATYTGPAYASATAVGTLPILIKGNISHLADSSWTIRVFNKDNTCFKDTTVTVKALVKDATVSVANGFPVCRNNGTTYTVKFTKSPIGAVVTAKNVATNAPITVTGDSIANIALSVAKVRLIVTNGVCKDSVDVTAPVCNQPVGSIGDLIWKDVNDNGLQDLPTEKGVAGVKVNLYAAAAGTKTGSVLQTKTTGMDGLYLFTGLLAGDYIVEIDKTTLKDTCAITPKQNIPGDDTKDSDFNPTSGLSQVITLAPVFNPTTPADILATNNLTVDAGLAVPCVKSSVTVTAAPVCSADIQTYSVTFSVTGKNGIIKVNKGTLTGSNPYTVTGIPSGATLKITDSLSAVCTFDTLITGPNCNCNPPLPILITPSLTACIGDTFPTLKATVVGMATVEWFTAATGGTAIFTGLNYKPAGVVTGDTVFYAQARSTDPTCPAAISTSRVMATVNAQNCTVEVDLALRKSINKKIAQLGDELIYTLKVFNQSNTAATGVEVTDSIATTVQFVAGSFAASRGSAVISGNVIQWTIGGIAANPATNGDTVTLVYKVKAILAGVHLNTAEISKTNEKDVDSTPGNGKPGEDDIESQCFTVPIKLCPSEKVQASVPGSVTNVQWYKNGGTTPVASGNTVLLTEAGTYTFTATNQTCPVGGCCPVIIEPGDNCCPKDVCIPFTVKKIKKK